eukprot:7766677-Pyramimonas_sp.AAC.1
MTTCLKATLCIADPVRLEYKDALLEMTAAKSTEVGKACLRHLSLAVKRSAHYTALKANPALSVRGRVSAHVGAFWVLVGGWWHSGSPQLFLVVKLGRGRDVKVEVPWGLGP